MRISEIDIMKGLGIILVLIGHIPMSSYFSIAGVDASIIADWVKRIIYSFHMPLFFLIAGYCAKMNGTQMGGGIRTYTIKKIKRLIMPYIVSYGLLIGWSCIPAICKQDWHIPIRHLLSMLWGNVEIIGEGTSLAYFGGIYITHTWFLLAMFWGLIFLFLLHSMPKSYLWICIVISWFAGWLYPNLKMCPWSILQGFGALSFLAIGQWLRTHKLPIAFWILCVFCWLIVIVVKPFSLSMVGNDYGCYPLNILAGLGGSYVLYYLAKLINRFAFSRRLWISLGTISLPILCFHEIEPLTDIYNSISLRLSDYVQIPQMLGVMIRYTCVIIFAYICVKTPILKKIYGRNDS